MASPGGGQTVYTSAGKSRSSPRPESSSCFRCWSGQPMERNFFRMPNSCVRMQVTVIHSPLRDFPAVRDADFRQCADHPIADVIKCGVAIVGGSLRCGEVDAGVFEMRGESAFKRLHRGIVGAFASRRSQRSCKSINFVS